MLRLPRIVLVAAFMMVTPTYASAQSPQVSGEEQFYEFFTKVCLLNMPRLDKVRAAARMLNWKPITGDAATLVAPSDPNSTSESWGVLENGRTMVVAISEGKMNSRKIVVCSAVDTKVNPALFVKTIQAYLKVPVVNDEVENMQRHRGWIGQIKGEEAIIQLTTAASDATSGAVLAVLMSSPNK